ncbi:MAG: AAA family ATPase [Tepidisphaeraceae bacterium]
MAKSKNRQQFLCSQCGSVHPKWIGKCPDCGAWDTLEAYTPPTEDPRKPMTSVTNGAGDLITAGDALRMDEIELHDVPRTPTGIGELDRVLGGGIVPGAAILVGGEPGIGKSTLLLQMAGTVASGQWAVGSNNAKQAVAGTSSLPTAHRTLPTLYVTSEESAGQTKLRAKRLGLDASALLILAETNLERIAHQIARTKAKLVVIDSIQMIYKPDLPAAPGSVTQLRDCCTQLVYLAKTTGVAIVFVGHVTKAGTLAGPKIIEHIVDTVVYFEGDRYHAHRIVRCVKNRFGSTHEVGLFEMTGSGLTEVKDPGSLFARPYGPEGPPSGSVLTAALTGSRVMLLEVQALTASSVVGAARRKVSGVSGDRVAMIIAVLEKRCGLRLAAEDVFVNLVGGAKIPEPAIDLAVALAIASAYADRPLPAGTMAVGELGLGGEVRSVTQLDTRLREGARLGVSNIVLPAFSGALPTLNGVSLHGVRRLQQAIADLSIDVRRRRKQNETRDEEE